MKISAFILSLLILVLSLKPCSDGSNAEDLKKDNISLNHNHQEDHDDSCPVTCICSCCGMSVTFESIKIFTFRIHTEISNVVLSSYQSNYQFDSVAAIWQPPQLIS